MGITKRFDRKLYEENDKIVKEAIIKLFENTKFSVVENPKKTKVDLLVYDNNNNHILNIEGEKKISWKESKFSYSDVNIPERKNKYCNLEVPTIFVMFNKELTDYLVIRDTDVISSPLVEVPNRFSYKGEFFYKIGLTKVIFNDIHRVIKEVLNDRI